MNPFYDLIDDGGKHRNVDYKYNKKEHAYDYTALRDIKKGENYLLIMETFTLVIIIILFSFWIMDSLFLIMSEKLESILK